MRIVMDKDIQGSLLYYIDSRWMCAKEDKAGVSLRGNFITNMRRRRKWNYPLLIDMFIIVLILQN